MNILTTVYQDPSYHTFYDIARTVEIPAFVKEASAEDSDVCCMTGDVFGDPARRKYPLNNRSNTWLSRQYFERERKGYDQKTAALVEQRIGKAAKFWGLSGEVKRLAADESRHVIRIYENAKQLFDVELQGPQHYKEAAEHLETHKKEYPYSVRRSFARGLLTAPDEFKAPLKEHTQTYLEKAAGFGMTTRARMSHSILSRVANCADVHTELSSRLTKLSSLTDDLSVTPALLHKVAVMLDYVDRATGLIRYYDRGIDSPEESLFSIIEKQAQEALDNGVALSTGTVFTKQGLANSKPLIDQFFDNHIGQIPYSTVDEMIEQVAALPRPDAQVLENILEG